MRTLKVLANNVKYPVPRESGYNVEGLGNAYARVEDLAKWIGAQLKFEDTLESAAGKISKKQTEIAHKFAIRAKDGFSEVKPLLEQLSLASSGNLLIIKNSGGSGSKPRDLSSEIRNRTGIIEQFLEQAIGFLGNLEKFVKGTERINELKSEIRGEPQ